MAVAASLLRNEMRRHLLMNLGLVASCVVGGTVVTNERGLFVPLGIHSMSETAKAFAAMFTPSHLLPGFVNVGSVVPLEPFDVTADSRDLRRRLMEVADTTGAAAEAAEQQTTELAQGFAPSPTLTPTELADNAPTAGVGQSKSAESSSSSKGSDSSTPAGSAPVQQQDAQQQQTQQQQQTGNDAAKSTLPTTGQSTQGSTLADPTQNSTANEGGGDGTTNSVAPVTPVDPGGNTTPVPEPSMWVMLLGGFGTVGYVLRAARRRRAENDADAEADAA